MQSWIERIYRHSPVLLQHAMISAYGWRLARLRYGGRYHVYLEELLQSQRYSEGELAELQNHQLRSLIVHCYENVPYYARLMRELKLTPSHFKTAADLGKLPVLEKETVRSQPELFLAQNYLQAPCDIVNTSGTTGTTLRIRVDLEGRRRNYAFFSRSKMWAGVDPQARTATFGGRTIVPVSSQQPPFWRYNFAADTLIFSSYHLSEKNLPAYRAKLVDWNPELIDTYPSSLHTVAQYVLEHPGPVPHPKAVITSSETLLAEQRAAITQALGTRVFDQYGGAEQVCFISECEAGSYHVHPEFGVTEFVADSSPEASSGFKIIATGFTNWAMPFLRYNTGDVAIPASRACPCGRRFPGVEQILGRFDDLIITPDGRRVGRLDPVFKGLETIRRAQIVQEDLRRIRILVVPGKGFLPQHLDSVRHELIERLGEDIEYIFETVPTIPGGAAGKFRAVISRIAKDGKGPAGVKPGGER